MGVARAHLDDGRDELHQEARHLEQRGVEGVHEVHDEALDVAAVVVLQAGRQAGKGQQGCG